MVSQGSAIRQAGLECTYAAARQCTATKMRMVLVAAMTVAFALALSTSARATTIMVDSLVDTGAPGICVLRDAITEANTMTATNGCAAGDGNDTIQFSVTGTISLASTLPQITDGKLTINGPASPGITISGGGQVEVMQVASGATLTLSKLTIAHGLTMGSGGAIANSGTLTVTNSTFSGNTAGFDGGAIINACPRRGCGNTLTVINSTFLGNSAPDFGGSIANDSTMFVSNSIFTRNIGGDGGGIYSDGPLTITNSTLTVNSALDGGGIFSGYAAIVINNTFSGNSATQGGGIFNGHQLSVTDSTFWSNSAQVGAGILTFTGPPPSEVSKTRIKSTILAASSGPNCTGRILTDRGYNISDDATCGFSATGSLNNTDPQLDPAGLSNNGGPTQTIALLSGSPAIDAIPLADCTDQASPPNPIITDQRLFPRPDVGEASCDIGAYEFQDSAFVPFSRFHGHMGIHPRTGVFYLSGGFKLGAGGSIDARTQPVAFSVGSYAIRLPAGSFVDTGNGSVYQKTVNGIFLCLFIKSTDTPGQYVLLANRRGGTLAHTGSPVPVTLTIGDDSGSTQMNVKFE